MLFNIVPISVILANFKLNRPKCKSYCRKKKWKNALSIKWIKMWDFNWNCYRGKSCFEVVCLKRIMTFCRLFLADWCFLTIPRLSVIIWKCALSLRDLCLEQKLINSNKTIKSYVHECQYAAVTCHECCSTQ